jgi:hypothetical protein
MNFKITDTVMPLQEPVPDMLWKETEKFFHKKSLAQFTSLEN